MRTWIQRLDSLQGGRGNQQHRPRSARRKWRWVIAICLDDMTVSRKHAIANNIARGGRSGRRGSVRVASMACRPLLAEHLAVRRFDRQLRIGRLHAPPKRNLIVLGALRRDPSTKASRPPETNAPAPRARQQRPRPPPDRDSRRKLQNIASVDLAHLRKLPWDVLLFVSRGPQRFRRRTRSRPASTDDCASNKPRPSGRSARAQNESTHCINVAPTENLKRLCFLLTIVLVSVTRPL